MKQGLVVIVQVPLPSAVLVVKAEGVHHLVLDGAVAHAPAPVLVVYVLLAAEAADVRVASTSYRQTDSKSYSLALPKFFWDRVRWQFTSSTGMKS